MGYTPQLAVSVWLGHERPAPLLDAAGQPIKGEGLPATLWSTFLGRALAGTPPTAFPVAEEVPPPAEAPGRPEI